MVEIIGVATIVALSWVLATSMANESEAEKRRCALPGARAMAEDPTVSATKHAA